MSNPYQFNLHFGGSSYMDAEAFIACVTDMNIIVHEINNELKHEKSVQLTVYPLKEGSVELWCGLLADTSIMGAVESLVNKDRVEYAANIIGIFSGYLQLKKFLKGKKEVEGEYVQKADNGSINIKSGDTVLNINATTVNIYQNNPIVDKATGDMFEKLERSQYVKDFTLGDNVSGTLFNADKKEFAELAKRGIITEEMQVEKMDIDPDANIYLNGLAFDGKHKWYGVYNNQKISFKVADADFINRLDEPEIRFHRSTIMNCQLSITSRFDQEAGVFIIDNTQYKVEKVKSLKEASSQKEIQF